MIIDLSNYRLKEDICATMDDSGSAPAETPVVRMSDIIIGGKGIGELMAMTTDNEPEFNNDPIPGVQWCRYALLPEEIGLTSYYEIYQTLLTVFGTTEEELLANDGEMEIPISSVKLGNDVFNATTAWLDGSARYLNVEILGQTFHIDLNVGFINPNLISASGGTFNEYFSIDIRR